MQRLLHRQHPRIARDITARIAACKYRRRSGGRQRGAVLAHQGRFREAAAAFDEACDFDPENAKGFSNLGVVLRRFNDLNGAIVQFEEAIRLRPEFTDAHYNLGNAYSALGESTLAAERYRAALTYRSD